MCVENPAPEIVSLIGVINATRIAAEVGVLFQLGAMCQEFASSVLAELNQAISSAAMAQLEAMSQEGGDKVQ